MNGVGRIKREYHLISVFDVELDEIVVVIVSIEDKRTAIKRPKVDEYILLEEATQSHVVGSIQCCGIGFHKRRGSSESNRVLVDI